MAVNLFFRFLYKIRFKNKQINCVRIHVIYPLRVKLVEGKFINLKKKKNYLCMNSCNLPYGLRNRR